MVRSAQLLSGQAYAHENGAVRNALGSAPPAPDEDEDDDELLELVPDEEAWSAEPQPARNAAATSDAEARRGCTSQR